MEEITCFLCESKENCSICEECQLVSVCSLHQPLHKSESGRYCYPWKVENRKDKGRVVVAVRDVSPLELVLEDRPVGLAPTQDSPRVCLTCFRLLGDTPAFYCECGFPMCNQICSNGSRHRAECKIFSAADKANQDHTDYQLIMPIRIMSELEQCDILKSRLGLLMDHEKRRREEGDNWTIIHRRVVEPIRNRLKMERWSEDELQWCVGITRTNATQVRGTGVEPGHVALDDSELGTARVLYPSMSLMSHSCIPNTRTIHSPGYGLVVRTLRDVKRGDELTISYSELLAGSIERKKDFERNWFFTCQCSRCCDVTDLGSSLDTWVCTTCSGDVCPANIDSNTDWKCCGCETITSHHVIAQKTDEILKELLNVEILGDVGDFQCYDDKNSDVWFYENFLDKYKTILHPKNSLNTRAKLKLLMAYKNPKSPKHLQRKIELCQEILTLLDTIQPGFSDTRGLVEYHLSAPLAALLHTQFQSGIITLDHFITELRRVERLLSNCILCLSVEFDGTYRHMVCESAKKALLNITELVQFAHFL